MPFSDEDRPSREADGVVPNRESVSYVLDRCESLSFEPKVINVMPDVPRFLGAWMNPNALRTPAVLAVSPLGNVNRVGEAGIQEADDLDPLHPSWTSAIEPAIAPLINWIALEEHHVTYDSCQGHEDQETPSLRLGVLPRNLQEAVAVGSVLTRLSAARHSKTTRSTFSTRSFASSLTCQRTGGTYLTLEYEACAAPGVRWDAFLDHRGALVDELIHSLTSPR